MFVVNLYKIKMFELIVYSSETAFQRTSLRAISVSKHVYFLPHAFACNFAQALETLNLHY